jgi:hypothetical protein
MAEEKKITVVSEDDHRTNTGKTPLHQTHMKTKAAGIPALLSSLEQMLKYMSPADAWKAAFAMNQKTGFDCPGCAWPDPDDDRSSLGEYCENGIKAIAEEAQHITIGADFFQKHTISEMLSWSDFELGKKGTACRTNGSARK